MHDKSQWAIAYHRIIVSREEQKPCDCKDCREYMASLGLDTRGKELKQ